MLQVRKRDGQVEKFNLKKIQNAIEKAFMAEHKIYNDDMIELLALRVTAEFNKKIKNGVVDIEDIQDAVEVALVQAGYVDVARSYIIYRKQHQNLRNISNTSIDYKNIVDDYLKINDWRVKENSTVTYSVGGLILSNSGAVTANYWLSEIYDQEIANAHRNADIHIHDLSMLTGYCAGWSLKQLIQEGLGGVPGKITSSPASHLSTLCNQMVNFLGIMQNEWAGAQAFSSFDTYLAPFVKVDNLTYKQVKQAIQSFIYGVNTPSRWGTQAPFSNITLDWVVPNDMAELNCIVGGKEMPFKYKDCEKEMAMVNKAFIEIMIEGDANGRGFQYPIPTYSITRTFDWSETENNKLLFEMTAKYGTPYFSNYINSDMEPSDVRSMCPMTGDTEVIVSLDEGVRVYPIAEVYKKAQEGKQIKVLTTRGYATGKPVLVQKSDVLEIKVGNKLTVRFGENHLQPTKDNGTLMAKDLKVGMELPLFGNDKIKYYPIVSIEKVDYNDELYCFEVENEDHLFVLANGLVTHNCRLRLDLRELRKKSGGFFGSGESTGSIGVVTINMPRIAYLSTNKEEFYERLDHIMDISARSLKVKRDTITQLLEVGLYPYTKRYLGTFNNHFSTIGLVGMNEACLNARWIKKDLTNPEAVEFTKEVLNHMRERLSDYQELYGDLYNLEATPAESTAFRLAKHDRKQYPDIITASEGDRTPYYTNSSHLPVGYTDDIFKALDIQDQLQTLYTSGTVFHCFLGQKLPSWKAAMNLVRKIAENYRLPYYTMSPTYSVCKDHGYIQGEEYTCPKCGQKTEVYSRITGYYRPVQNWNDGKSEEFKNRKTYNLSHSHLEHGPLEAPEGEESCKEDINELLLFATKTCPNCKMAKMLLDKAGIKYRVIDAEDDAELTKRYGVKKAPTLLVPKECGYTAYENASNIKGYIESLN